MSEWLQIARFEFLRVVKQRSYLFFTIGMPLFIIAMSTIPAIIEMRQAPPTVGYVDQSGIIADAPSSLNDVTLQSFSDEAAGRAALDDEQIDSLWLIPADYLSGGAVQEVVAGDSSSRQREAISALLRRNLAGGVDPTVVDRLEQPANWTYQLLGSDRQLHQGVELIVALGIPIALSFILMISIMFSSGFLAQAIAEERENRLLEILITSTSLRSILTGKLLGLSGVALVQVALWMVALVIAALLILASGELPSGLPIPWDVLLMSLPFYLLAFLLFATLIIGAGAMLGDVRAAQQAASFVGMLGLLPIYLIVPILTAPSGTFARLLSLIPFSAPTAVPARLALGQIELWEWGLSLGILAFCVVGSLWLVARLMSAATLRYGTRLTINDIFARPAR
ncbi:MAG: ABC transporter permease [Anaerolineales bacterium]|nr:ABC transporter permease [Anaerolineales bacterium]MCB9127361.1 ABC transporter permease [Ardenticatenales bacterium]MCB9172696.1 ABC transporter permease [Ardenticatenales bacterium]